MTSNEIKAAIISGNFSNDELSTFSEAVRYAKSQLAKTVSRDLSSGVKVKFRDRTGSVYHGVVESIKVKNAVVMTGAGRYRVPMNLLEVA